MATTAREERWIAARIGGRYTILGLITTAHAITHVYFALMPLVYVVVMKEFAFSYAELGLMVGISSLVGGVLQLAFGFISRHVLRKLLLGFGTILLGASMIATGLCATFWQLWGANLAAQGATAPQHPVGNSIVADKFGRRLRGTALAINFAGGNAGTVVIPVIATALILAVGWRWTLVIAAIPTILMGLALIVLLQERRGEVGSALESGKTDGRAELLHMLTTRNIAIVFLVSMVASGGRGLGAVLVFMPQYLKNGLQLEDQLVGLMFSIVMLGSVVGPLIVGRLSDISGRKRVLLGAYLASAAFTVVVVHVGGNLWLLAPALVLMGLAVFSESPVLQSLLADVTQGGSRDIAFGFYFTATQAAGSLWLVLLGAVVDSRGFGDTFYVMALSYLAAGALVLWAREARRP